MKLAKPTEDYDSDDDEHLYGQDGYYDEADILAERESIAKELERIADEAIIDGCHEWELRTLAKELKGAKTNGTR